jgi:hypothetical protein
VVGSLVDDLTDGQQPNVIIRDFGQGSLPPSELSRTNVPRPAFCVLKM